MLRLDVKGFRADNLNLQEQQMRLRYSLKMPEKLICICQSWDNKKKILFQKTNKMQRLPINLSRTQVDEISILSDWSRNRQCRKAKTSSFSIVLISTLGDK